MRVPVSAVVFVGVGRRRYLHCVPVICCPLLFEPTLCGTSSLLLVFFCCELSTVSQVVLSSLLFTVDVTARELCGARSCEAYVS